MEQKYSTGKVTLKGSGNFLKLTVPVDLEVNILYQELDRIIEEAEGLLANVDIIIDLQDRVVEGEFLLSFISYFVVKNDLKVASWISGNTETLHLFKKIGLVSSMADSPSARSSGSERETLLLKSSLRSGQRIEHNGDVVVIGHVNNGAEILATGNITVCGKLKGLLHAGYESGKDHVIMCHSFEAKQVRLGGKLSTLLNSRSELWGKAVVISLEKDSLLMREVE